MVNACSPQLDLSAVHPESVYRIKCKRANAKGFYGLIQQFAIMLYPYSALIQLGMITIPQIRLQHTDTASGCFQRPRIHNNRLSVTGNPFSILFQLNGHGYSFPDSADTLDFRLYFHNSRLFICRQRSDSYSICGDVNPVPADQLYISVNSASRVPTAVRNHAVIRTHPDLVLTSVI